MNYYIDSEVLLLFFCVLGPGDKGKRPAAGTKEAEGESNKDMGSKTTSSPLKRTSFRAPAVSSVATFSHR